MHRQLASVHQKSSHEPVEGSSSIKTGMDPTHTGTTAAGRVFGLTASIHDFIVSKNPQHLNS